MHPVIKQLEQDHQRMLRTLYKLNAELGKFCGLHQGEPSIDAILGVLEYIRIYPEKHHHPLEDILFQQLLTHPEADGNTIEVIIRDHQRLEALSEQLLQMFHESEASTGTKTAKLSVIRLCKHFYTRQITHIHEERRIYAQAQALFSEAEWMAIEAKFSDFLNGKTEVPHALQDFPIFSSGHLEHAHH